MGLFSGGKEGEPKKESKPYHLEWIISEGPDRIARIAMNREYPLSDKKDLFIDMIGPGLKEIVSGGNTILSIAPTYIDPGSGDVLDFVVVAKPTPPIE